MSASKRIQLIASVLLGLTGIYTFPEDIGSMSMEIWEAIRSNPVGAGFIVASLTLAAYSLRDEITKLLGLRTNRRLAAIITDWTHIRNDFELQNTQIDKEGFQLTVKRAGATIAVSKNKKAQFIVVSCAFLMGGQDAEILSSGPLDLRKELFYQISMDMVKLGADFDITTYTDDSGANTWQIERVYLRKMVDPASLTEYSFLEQAGSVVRAIGSINLLVSIYAARAHPLIDSDDLLVERITDWLHLRNGYQLLETNNDQKGIRLVAKRGDTTVIIQKNKGARSMDLMSGVVFTPEHKAAMEGASSSFRHELFEQVGLDVLKLGVQMRLDAAEDGTWMIQRLEVRKSIDPTSLEELPFLENIGLVFRAAAVGSLTMARYARIAREQQDGESESND